MDPFRRQSGPWTIAHEPVGHNAYDRVLGRLSAWALVISHESGWRIVEHEGEATAAIYSPGGLLVGAVVPEELAPDHRPSLTSGRSALVAWTHAHAAEFDETDILAD